MPKAVLSPRHVPQTTSHPVVGHHGGCSQPTLPPPRGAPLEDSGPPTRRPLPGHPVRAQMAALKLAHPGKARGASVPAWSPEKPSLGRPLRQQAGLVTCSHRLRNHWHHLRNVLPQPSGPAGRRRYPQPRPRSVLGRPGVILRARMPRIALLPPSAPGLRSWSYLGSRRRHLPLPPSCSTRTHWPVTKLGHRLGASTLSEVPPASLARRRPSHVPCEAWSAQPGET